MPAYIKCPALKPNVNTQLHPCELYTWYLESYAISNSNMSVMESVKSTIIISMFINVYESVINFDSKQRYMGERHVLVIHMFSQILVFFSTAC